MDNLVNYTSSCFETFEKKALNELDALVFSYFSYFDFPSFFDKIKTTKGLKIKNLNYLEYYDTFFNGTFNSKQAREMFMTLVASPRYRDIRVRNKVQKLDQESEKQFYAITFDIDKDTIFIAFRGTDASFTGWKEDFNMAFLSPIPGQEYGVGYLNSVADKIRVPFYVGGHSKGGNLAVYSAMNCRPEVQDRIIRIFSMDGPGFRPEVLEKDRYDLIADRVTKILPHSSLVGMLFESDMNYQVVASKTFGLAQHDPYTWLVEGDHLKHVNDIYERRKRMDNTLNTWILSLDEKQLRIFVDTLYQVISASKADNLIEFTAEWKTSMNRIVAALKEVDEDTVKVLKTVIKALFEIAGANMKEEISKSTRDVIFGTKELMKQSKSKHSRRKLQSGTHQDAPDATAPQESAKLHGQGLPGSHPPCSAE